MQTPRSAMSAFTFSAKTHVNECKWPSEAVVLSACQGQCKEPPPLCSSGNVYVGMCGMSSLYQTQVPGHKWIIGFMGLNWKNKSSYTHNHTCVLAQVHLWWRRFEFPQPLWKDVGHENRWRLYIIQESMLKQLCLLTAKYPRTTACLLFSLSTFRRKCRVLKVGGTCLFNKT